MTLIRISKAAAAALVVLSALSVPTAAQESKASFAVVKVGEDSKIVTSDELTALPKQLDQEFRAATKRWNEARAAAKKNKQAFEEPRPKAVRVKVLAKNLKTREAAQQALDKIHAKGAAKGGGFAVVKSGNEVHVMASSKVRAFKKSVADAHKRAVADYRERKKIAAKSKEKFEEEPPVLAKVVVVKTGFATEAEAEAFGKESAK